MQRIYIPLDLTPHPTRAALSGDIGPAIAATLGTELDIAAHFFKDSTQEALAAESTGKLTLKAPGALAGVALFLDPTMSAEGTGASTFYKFTGVLNSDELTADLGELEFKTYRASIAWTEPGKAEDKCLDFDIVVFNSSTRPEDTIPATTDARWEWIKNAAPEAGGFLHNDEAKTLAVGAPDAHAGSHGVGGADPIIIAQSQVSDLATALAGKVPTTRTINGHALSGNVTLAKGDIGLGSVDNTSDATKPISGATQTALNGKEPTQTPASQAEAQAGTQTAIRSFSPLRIKQAIVALASAGGGNIIRAWGALSGWTTPETPSLPPAQLEIQVSAGEGSFQISLSGSPTTFSCFPSDPTDGTVWVDTSSVSSGEDLAILLESILASALPLTVTRTGSTLFVFYSNTGSSSTLECSGGSALISFSGGGNGSDSVSASGQVLEVEFGAIASGKITFPMKLGYSVESLITNLTVEFAFKSPGGSYTPLGDVVELTSVAHGEIVIGQNWLGWINGSSSDSLIARITNESLPEGGIVHAWAIAEQK